MGTPEGSSSPASPNRQKFVYLLRTDQNSNIIVLNYIVGVSQLSGVNCQGSIFGGSIVGGSFVGGQLSGVNCRGSIVGGSIVGGNCRGSIVGGSIVAHPACLHLALQIGVPHHMSPFFY